MRTDHYEKTIHQHFCYGDHAMLTQTLTYSIITVNELEIQIPHDVLAWAGDTLDLLVLEYRGVQFGIDHVDLWTAAWRAGVYNGRVTLEQAEGIEPYQTIDLRLLEKLPMTLLSRSLSALTLPEFIEQVRNLEDPKTPKP